MMFSGLVLAQSPKPTKEKVITVKQKVCRSQKGFQFVLKTIESDSRCPKGTTCIWAGEVSAVLQVFDGQKQVEEVIMIFSEKIRRLIKNGSLNICLLKNKKLKACL